MGTKRDRAGKKEGKSKKRVLTKLGRCGRVSKLFGGVRLKERSGEGEARWGRKFSEKVLDKQLKMW